MTDRIRGRCPMGCGETLFVGAGGHLTCSLLGCPNPSAVDELLSDPLGHVHVVRFGDDGFDVQHPLVERGEDLIECVLHQHIRFLDGPPVQPGRYIARHDGERWTWTALLTRVGGPE